MGVYIVSNIVEQIVRIAILIFLIPICLEKCFDNSGISEVDML